MSNSFPLQLRLQLHKALIKFVRIILTLVEAASLNLFSSFTWGVYVESIGLVLYFYAPKHLFI